MNTDLLMLILLILAVVLLAAVFVVVLVRTGGKGGRDEELLEALAKLSSDVEKVRKEMFENLRQGMTELRTAEANDNSILRKELSDSFLGMRTEQGASDTKLREELSENLTALRTEISARLSEQARESEQKFDNIRKTMETKIGDMQQDNAKQLEKMRQTVDEKLQDTLNKRISESFRNVQEQLLLVSEGLGDMKRLATDVGDLRNVMKNVKTKGLLGEYQLGAIIEEILPREQYEENIATKEGSQDRVEFAVRMPGDGDKPVYLPIDAKFPSKPYEDLLEARESGKPELAAAAQKVLAGTVKQMAKTIHEKYVQPPDTTDFAILFLPFEGLYAEVINMGLVSELQTLYKVNIAGPTTMAALLNSMQMGFRTLAIQKRSAEVWNVLGSVKTEFATFEKVLESAQKRINQANSDLDKLIGTRTRAINRRLRGVTSLTGGEDGEDGEFEESGLVVEGAGEEGEFEESGFDGE